MSPLGFGVLYIVAFSACLVGIALTIDGRLKKKAAKSKIIT